MGAYSVPQIILTPNRGIGMGISVGIGMGMGMGMDWGPVRRRV